MRRRLASALAFDVATIDDALGIVEQVLPIIGPHGHLDLGPALLMLREYHGLSAAAIGRCVGVTGGTVRRWETGKTRPSRTFIARLAAAFEVPADDLLMTVGSRLAA